MAPGAEHGGRDPHDLEQDHATGQGDTALTERLKGKLGKTHDRPGQLAGRLSEYAELAGLVLAFVAKLRGGGVLTAADVMAEADKLCASVQALGGNAAPAIDPVQAP